MATAGKKDTSPELGSALHEGDWIPPDHIEATTLAREHGVDNVRDDLFRGRRHAFRWNTIDGGPLHPIAPEFWGSNEAGRCLKEGGFPPPFKVIVRVKDETPPPPPMGRTAGKPTSSWMPLREALERAGRLIYLLPPLRYGGLAARHGGLYSLDGKPKKAEHDRIPADWWDYAQDIDPITGRAHFSVGERSRIPNRDGGFTADTLAIGIELERLAVERMFPAAASPLASKPTKAEVMEMKAKVEEWFVDLIKNDPVAAADQNRSYEAAQKQFPEFNKRKWFRGMRLKKLPKAPGRPKGK